ncbi:SPOR domain-containing protein [Aurantivibrio plasticivorans]
MSRDYKRRNNSSTHRESRIPGWVWLFTGSILGAFVMFLFYLKDIPKQPATLMTEFNGNDTNKSAAPKIDETKDEDGVTKPRFVFYELLKENEVVVDTTPIDMPEANEVKEDIEYMLQAGSFRNAADADRLRAQLILQNLNATVEKKLVRDQPWHRVMVGPFKTRAQASKARGTLASMDIDSIMSKQTVGGG